MHILPIFPFVPAEKKKEMVEAPGAIPSPRLEGVR